MANANVASGGRDLQRHYQIETALADRLRNANKAERKTLYRDLYNELFRSVPDHPQCTFAKDPEAIRRETLRQFGIIKPFLKRQQTLLEIGAGGCHLSVMLAEHVRHVYPLDVSDEISGKMELPSNCTLILSDGVEVPLPDCSVDLAYSNQLMEHLHPDDAREQLSEIYRVLRPGGLYICITPNKLCGPHDVSRGFDQEPRGFHLREYDNRDLAKLFREVGFRESRVLLSYESAVVPFTIPAAPVRFLESLLQVLPHAIRSRAAFALLGAKFVGVK